MALATAATADQIRVCLNFISRSLRGQIGAFFRAERAPEFAKALSLIKIRFAGRIPPVASPFPLPTTMDNIIFQRIVYHRLFSIRYLFSEKSE